MEFLELLEKIKKRPALYLRKNSIYYLEVFLTGYQCACEIDVDFRLFSYWVEHKYEICNSAWSWSRILHHASGSEEKALFLFFREFDNYLTALKKNKVPKHRVEFGAPKESVTDEYWAFMYQ